MKKQDLTGKRYGKFVVTHQGPHQGMFIRWFCLCDCGKETLVFASALRGGTTKSCGCLRGESHGEAYRANVKPATKEYRAWRQIKTRCFNTNVRDYKYYGARGITMCAEWRESFSTFLTDVGRAPDGSMSIDRKDNSGNYEPGNVRWATKSVQMKNRRKFHIGKPAQ